MPVIKEYNCTSCGFIVERWHVEGKPHEKPLCPACMIPCKQMFYPSGISLKGLGWGRDGYSKDIDDAEICWRIYGK